MTAILLTSTIAPKADASKHVLFDVQDRLAQYIAALKYYITASGPGYKILFVDNSGHPVDKLQEVAADNPRADRPVFIFSYDSTVPASWGKGHGEMRLIEEALSHFSSTIDENEKLWKITGRLQVRNLGRMIETAPADFEVYADFRDVPLIGESLGGNQWMDTRIFGFTPKGYDKHIRQNWPEHVFVLEKLLFSQLKPRLQSEPGIVPRFAVQPDINGTSGGSGNDYTSFSYRSKNNLRKLSRMIWPKLWL